MNKDLNNKKGTKNWIPVAIIAAVALGAGVYVSTQVTIPNGGGRYNASDANNAQQQQEIYNSKEFDALQAKLENSTLLPDDFKKVPPFSLLQAENKALTEADLRDKWSVLFFGFTNCPDVCPITLNEMNGVVAQLANENSTVPQVMFITVDPVRDTIEKMSEYVGYFNEDFIAGTGELADITALTSKLGIVASYTADENGGNNYSVDHTASMLLIDPSLRVRAKLNPPHKIDTLAADLKTLISHYN